MLPSEAKWLEDQILGLELDSDTTVLNFGCQTSEALKRQPFIRDHVIAATMRRGWSILNFDLHSGEGVDAWGDICQDYVFSDLLRRRFNVLYVFNVLEHVFNLDQICSRLQKLVSAGGYILVSVPYNFPLHNDPIDNGFRPTPSQLRTHFEDCILQRAAIVVDRTWGDYLKEDPRATFIYFARLLFPMYRPRNWWTQVVKLAYLNRSFKITCCVFQKL